MTSFALDAPRLDKIFLDCLPRTNENAPGMFNRLVNGMHSGRLESYRDEIEAMVALLPQPFVVTIPDAMSFLRNGFIVNGEYWTNLDGATQQLISLGIALGKIEYQAPRSVLDELGALS